MGSPRRAPVIPPAAARGSGGAQKMSKGASKVGRSSLRLTNTARSAFRKSICCLRSIQPSARVASVNRRGPASTPASCKSRANAPSRGRRSGPSGTSRLLDERGNLLPHPLEVLLVFERRAEGRIDETRVDARRAQCSERSRPVERFRDTGHFVKVHRSQALDQPGHLAREAVGSLGGTRPHDLDFLLEVWVVDPVIEAAALERVVHLASPV